MRYLVVSLIILSVFLRIWQFSSIPVSLSWDEVSMLADAKAALSTGRDMHGNSIWQAIYPSWGDYKLPLYPILVIFSAKIVGISEIAVRLPSLIAGLFQLYLIFALSKVLFPKKKAIWWLSVVVLGFSPWSIVFARTGFEANLGQVLLSISIYFALASKNYKRKKLILLLASVVFGALSVYSYYSVRFVWPIVFASAVLLNQSFKKFNFVSLKNFIKITAPSLVLFSILILPILNSPHYQASQQFRLSTPSILNIQEFNEHSIELKNIEGGSIVGKISYHPRILQLKQFVTNYGKNLDPAFIFVHSDQNLRHTTARHGLFLLSFAPFLIIGVLAGISKYSRSSILLIIWWLVALIPASVSYEVPHALRSLNALVPISLLIAVGMFEAYKWTKQQKKLLASCLILLWSVFSLFNLLDFSSDYFFSYPNRSAAAWSDGYKQLVATTMNLENEYADIGNIYVDRSDGRIHLWFMAYGTTAGEDFEKLESDQFLFNSMGKIKFTSSPDLDDLSGHAIMVYPEGRVLELASRYNLQIIDTRAVKDVNGKSIAIVAVIKGNDE